MSYICLLLTTAYYRSTRNQNSTVNPIIHASGLRCLTTNLQQTYAALHTNALVIVSQPIPSLHPTVKVTPTLVQSYSKHEYSSLKHVGRSGSQWGHALYAIYWLSRMVCAETADVWQHVGSQAEVGLCPFWPWGLLNIQLSTQPQWMLSEQYWFHFECWP